MLRRIASVVGMSILGCAYVFNLLSGVVGGIWLGIIGKWSVIGWGIGSAIAVPFIMGLLLLPAMALAAVSGVRNRAARATAVATLPLIALYNALLISAWALAAFVFLEQHIEGGTAWPYMLWGYAVVMMPLAEMASGEDRDPAASIGTTMGLCNAMLTFGSLVVVRAVSESPAARFWTAAGVGIGSGITVMILAWQYARYRERHTTLDRLEAEAKDRIDARRRQALGPVNSRQSLAQRTMSIEEAQSIVDVVTSALTYSGPLEFDHLRPMSLFQGQSIFEIDAALKLRIAFFHLNPIDPKEFEETVRASGGLPLIILSTFAQDDQLAHLRTLTPGSREYHSYRFEISSPLDHDHKFRNADMAELETHSSFADFCKTLSRDDAAYWEKVYHRVGLSPGSRPYA